MTHNHERRTARAIHQSELDGRWVYEWNTGDVGKLVGVPDGFTFDPRKSHPVHHSIE